MRPCMHGILYSPVIQHEVPRNISSWNIHRSSARKEDVGMVLADTDTFGDCLLGAPIWLRGADFVLDRVFDAG